MITIEYAFIAFISPAITAVKEHGRAASSPRHAHHEFHGAPPSIRARYHTLMGASQRCGAPFRWRAFSCLISHGPAVEMPTASARRRRLQRQKFSRRSFASRVRPRTPTKPRLCDTSSLASAEKAEARRRHQRREFHGDYFDVRHQYYGLSPRRRLRFPRTARDDA